MTFCTHFVYPPIPPLTITTSMVINGMNITPIPMQVESVVMPTTLLIATIRATSHHPIQIHLDTPHTPTLEVSAAVVAPSPNAIIPVAYRPPVLLRVTQVAFAVQVVPSSTATTSAIFHPTAFLVVFAETEDRVA